LQNGIGTCKPAFDTKMQTSNKTFFLSRHFLLLLNSSWIENHNITIISR
jgi:hypothetical protein